MGYHLAAEGIKETRMDHNSILTGVTAHIQEGDVWTLEKRIAVASFRDGDPEQIVRKKLDALQSESFRQILKASSEAWGRIWEDADVEITGNDEWQGAIRYNIFQLCQAMPYNDPHASIGARGLTHGRYKGCYFWDTEIFMLPFFAHTQPKAARTLLEYRYHILPDTLESAKGFSTKGARYSWMSSDTGYEQCETWDTGCCEIHITADVAHAVNAYYAQSGDDAFMRDCGAEILIQTARYWTDRFTYSAGEDVYHLLFVKGPDEYCGVTADDFYTVSLAKDNLESAVRAVQWMQEMYPEYWDGLQRKISFSSTEPLKWLETAKKVVIGKYPESQVWKQDSTFHLLEPLDIEANKDDDTPLYHKIGFDRLQRYQVLKQPAVLMYMALKPHQFSREEMEAAWDYYVPKTLHDSTLSFGIHALLAARLGKTEEAVKYLEKSMFLDLKNVMKNTAKEGLHTAALGATWQAMVLGFGAVAAQDGQLTAQNLLPSKINSMSFKMNYQGKRYSSTNAESSSTSQISNSCVSFRIDENGHFVLRRNGTDLVAIQNIELLTDGTNVQAARLTLSAEQEDRFYGFGMRYDSLDQRGNTVDTYCVNWYKDQRGETYTPVPYYFVPDKYGLFIESTYYSQFRMCTADTGGTCVIEVDLGGTEDFELPIYLFSGDNAQIAASYSNVAGSAVLPPVWAFGPWISANEWNKQSEIMEQLEKTLELEIPTSVVVIEAWSDEETFYTFHDSKFETSEGGEALDYEDFTFTGRWTDPKGMVEALHENNVKCLLWQIPVLKYSTSATAQSVRDQIYAQEQGYVLEYEDGSTYRLPQGTWFGNSLLLDFTNEEATTWFLEKRRYLLEDIGIDGFKTDGGEFVWGRDVIASDGTKGDELRNAYPDLYAQAYYDFGNEVSEEIVTFSRAGGSSMQSHPLCWVGDQDSDFSAFQDAIRATLNASMSGIPFVAWDIAGFSGDVPSTELYLRSVAQAAFSPVMQVHSETAGDPEPSQARTPWNMAARKNDEACITVYRYYANLRMNLLPYIYTEAKWSSETGEPMMRSMAYAFPEDQTADEYEFQYLFGRSLLVAPVTSPNAKSVEVYLPEGIWYNFFTGERYESGVYRIPVEMDEIPVFVLEGTILPVNTDVSGELATYVGNGTDEYKHLGYLAFPGTGQYTWYDYVNETEILVSNDGTTVMENGSVCERNIIWRTVP